MSGFTISASEYQAMIARRDIRIAELESRLAKYEQPDDAEPVTEERFLAMHDAERRPDSTLRMEISILGGPIAYLYWEPQFGCDGWSIGIETIPPLKTIGQLRRLVNALRGEP